MKLEVIINKLQPDVNWVNWNETRDSLLVGDRNYDIKKVIVTWVATMDVVQQAIIQNIDLIITHENPFYDESTHLPEMIKKKRFEKLALLIENKISIYRCQELWDLYPQIGVRDQWS